jgi:hypothetical protein
MDTTFACRIEHGLPSVVASFSSEVEEPVAREAVHHVEVGGDSLPVDANALVLVHLHILSRPEEIVDQSIQRIPLLEKGQPGLAKSELGIPHAIRHVSLQSNLLLHHLLQNR